MPADRELLPVGVDTAAAGLELGVRLAPEQLALIASAVADLLNARETVTAEPWPEWMNVETAARYLDCTEERIRKLVERRQIPYYQEGPRCRVFFNRSELDQWMFGFRRETRQPHLSLDGEVA